MFGSIVIFWNKMYIDLSQLTAFTFNHSEHTFPHSTVTASFPCARSISPEALSAIGVGCCNTPHFNSLSCSSEARLLGP